METRDLKPFATKARNILIEGVVNRLRQLGYSYDNTTVELPQIIEGGSTWRNTVQSEEFYYKFISLDQTIQNTISDFQTNQRKSLAESRKLALQKVSEDAAYTWFNRLVAIRIMEKAKLIAPKLEKQSDNMPIPFIVSEAKMFITPPLTKYEQSRFDIIVDDPTKDEELFGMLIVAFCRETPLINKVFGGIEDYTVLLLPNNIMRDGGFLQLMYSLDNTITDEDWRTAELIGWMYQFYVSERKALAFSKDQYDTEDLAPATQIFTPNWIVKYMAQNTIGRMYLDNNPNDTRLKTKWKYLVEPSQPTPKECIFLYDDLKQLTIADLACGSGHILNECFDILLDLYNTKGLDRNQAIRNIFEYNLTGVELDSRAKQLATFALMMKACLLDKSFADATCLPRVIDMPKVNRNTWEVQKKDFCKDFGIIMPKIVDQEISDAFALMENADTLGSIMIFKISAVTRDLLLSCFAKQAELKEKYSVLIHGYDLILALTDNYAALAMNPPYMGSGKMTNLLSNYVKSNYTKVKGDLCTVFAEIIENKCKINGKASCIIMESWMFLKSFEDYRRDFLKNCWLESLIHMPYEGHGRTSLGINFGTSVHVFSKNNGCDNGNYQCVRHFEIDEDGVPLSFPMENERRSFVSQTSLSKIPGSPIGYWLSSTFIDGWSKFQYLSNKLTTREGMATADNERFLRLWFEPDFTKIDLRYVESKENSAAKWFPYNKGGDFRRWYGNIIYVVNWENDGYDIKNNIDENTGRIRSHNYNGEYAFHEGLTWTALSSGLFAIRYSPAGFLWDSKGAMGFTDYKNECLSFLNSIVARQYLKVIAGTKDYKVGDIIMLPYNPQDQDRETFDLCNNNISISKQDWDAHETSWDFAENELIRICKSSGKRDIEALISLYIQYWENQLRQLHTNEEKLNRKFIEIFGLQDELLPDVPLKEISILQEGEVDIDENSITWNKDVIIKQLISYAIGCMMGRYRLDRPKIQIAHQNPTQEEIAPYEYNGEMFTIDDDGIIPIVEEDGIFDDNALDRMNSFIGQVFGRDNIENANTMNNHLGNNVDLKKYLCTKFYADHLSMYSNLPIYWQFSSKVCAPPRSRSNGAFKALVYIHRMTPFTLQVLHDKYLMHYISRLDGIIKNAEQDNSFNQREIDLLKAKLAECRAYEPILKNLADQQIAIELDNGIAKNYELFQEVLSKRK